MKCLGMGEATLALSGPTCGWMSGGIRETGSSSQYRFAGTTPCRPSSGDTQSIGRSFEERPKGGCDAPSVRTVASSLGRGGADRRDRIHFRRSIQRSSGSSTGEDCQDDHNPIRSSGIPPSGVLPPFTIVFHSRSFGADCRYPERETGAYVWPSTRCADSWGVVGVGRVGYHRQFSGESRIGR